MIQTTVKLCSVDQYRQLRGSLLELSPEMLSETVRDLARTDLYFLLTHLLHRTDMEHPWLLARCKEVEAEPNSRLDLWAREHYKSTIITYGKTIQDVLATHGDGAIGEELTACIFSHTRPNAKKFLAQIMREFEGNADLKELFPDILWADPKNQAAKWSLDDGIIVKRRGNPKEATIEAHGLVDGQPVGPHYRLRVYDDTVTEQSVTSPEMIEKTTKMWELSTSLGTTDGVERYAGTFYKANDSYSTMIERGVRPRIYPATKDGTDDTRQANCVFMSEEVLTAHRRKKGPNTFATQMLLNPKGGLIAGFDEAWLRYWPCEHVAYLSIALLVDPASKKKKTSDYTSMWVVGLGSDNKWYVCDHIKDRLNLTERVRMAFVLHRKWSPIFVGWEEYGLQSDIEAMQWQMNLQNYRFEIYKLAGKIKKEDRIKRLQPIAQEGRLYLPEGGCVHTNNEGVAVDTIRSFIRNEWNLFPVVTHDDGLDSLSRIDDEIVKAYVVAPAGPSPVKSNFEQELIDEHYGVDGGGYNPNSWMGR